MRHPLRRVVAGATLALTAALALAGSPAAAADGASISEVKPTGKHTLQVLMSVPAGLQVDLEGVSVSIQGKDADATATQADSDSEIRRTTILAIDTSKSMKGQKFAAAQIAASTFLDTVPADVYVGITTFDSDVETALAPSLDREAARQVLAGLELNHDTRLYDGVMAAVEESGDEGQRSVLVLSDGADTSATALAKVTQAISDADVTVDVVSLDKVAKHLAPLQTMADAGSGLVINSDPATLKQTFTEAADALARQVLVTVDVPDTVTATEGTVSVSLPAGSSTLTAEAFGPLRPAGDGGTGATAPVRSTGFALPSWALLPALGLLGVGLLILATAFVPAKKSKQLSPEDMVTKYTQVTAGMVHPDAERSDRDIALAQAKEAAAQMLGRNQSLEARIAHRLENAGSSMKPAEWLLLHVGITVAAGLLGFVIGKGSFVLGILFTAAGFVVPWIVLGIRRSRRLKAFNSSLPDTLQLMAGSLQAGLSLAQSVDTIVREGTEPIASEFKRVLVETRLGVSLEDALEGITERFDSKDFAWVVMAIKIQRQVGGNLAELLNTVAGTMREREYMRRQVAALAAEGKLSAYVIGGLPPAFLVYLLLVNRPYVMPMFTDPRGWVLLGIAGVLLSAGGFWMSRLVKVEV